MGKVEFSDPLLIKEKRAFPLGGGSGFETAMYEFLHVCGYVDVTVKSKLHMILVAD